MLHSRYITPVMFTDSTGYFMFGVMVASIVISLIIEGIQDYREDGTIFNDGFRRYVGAGISGFFSGLTGTTVCMILYGFIGSSLDYFISGDYNAETLGRDLIMIGFSSAIGVGIGKGLKFGMSKLKANKLIDLGNNNLANQVLKKMGLNVKVGSNAAKSGLGNIIYESGKYFSGEIVENIGCNLGSSIANYELLLVFD